MIGTLPPIEDRLVYRRLLTLLNSHSTVILSGVRGIGKTRMLRALAGPNATIHDLSLRGEREAVKRDLMGFLKTDERPLVVDNAAASPLLIEAFAFLSRRAGKAGSFLLANSHQVSMDADATQLASVTLEPLTLTELCSGKGRFMAQLFLGQMSSPRSVIGLKTIRAEALVGGIPEIRLCQAKERREAIHNYLMMTAYRTLPTVYRTPNPEAFVEFLSSLASVYPGACNLNHLLQNRRQAIASTKTLRTYERLYGELYLTCHQPSWPRWEKKTTVKSSADYLCDTGLFAMLAQIDSRRLEEDEATDERFLRAVLRHELSVQCEANGYRLLHYAHRNGHRVPFVIESPEGELAAVDFTLSEKPTDKEKGELQWFARLPFCEGRNLKTCLLHAGKEFSVSAEGLVVAPFGCVLA